MKRYTRRTLQKYQCTLSPQCTAVTDFDYTKKSEGYKSNYASYEIRHNSIRRAFLFFVFKKRFAEPNFWLDPKVGKKSSLSKLDDISYRLVIWVSLLSSVLSSSSLPSLIEGFITFMCVKCSWWVPVAMSTYYIICNHLATSSIYTQSSSCNQTIWWLLSQKSLWHPTFIFVNDMMWLKKWLICLILWSTLVLTWCTKPVPTINSWDKVAVDYTLSREDGEVIASNIPNALVVTTGSTALASVFEGRVTAW